MATYPGAIVSLTNPTSTSKLNSPSHATQHENANDEVEAIETELGVDPAGSHTDVAGRLDAMDSKTSVMTHSWLLSSTALASAAYYRAPFACDVSGYVSFAVSSGTGRAVAVAHGSAGDNAVAVTSGVTGSIGAAVALTASAVPSFTSGEVFKVTMSSCSTVQYQVAVTLLLARSGTA